VKSSTLVIVEFVKTVIQQRPVGPVVPVSVPSFEGGLRTDAVRTVLAGSVPKTGVSSAVIAKSHLSGFPPTAAVCLPRSVTFTAVPPGEGSMVTPLQRYCSVAPGWKIMTIVRSAVRFAGSYVISIRTGQVSPGMKPSVRVPV
jgi:hypothetical protein